MRSTSFWQGQLTVAVLAALAPAGGATANEIERVEIVGGPDVALIFEPSEFAVAPGQEVELVFRNVDNNMQHNLLIVEPSTIDEVARQARDLAADGPDQEWVPDTDSVLHATRVLAPGETETLRFTAPQSEGVYPYVCTIPGHAQEMRGEMHVLENPDEFEPWAGWDQVPWSERYEQMDTGPFFSGVVGVPEHQILDKGLSIRLGDEQQATVHFDTDLLRISAGWTGDFLKFHSQEDIGIRNETPPTAAGRLRFTNPTVAGWSAQTGLNTEPQFHDPREHAFGEMPEPHGRYEGLYLHEDRVVLAYTAHDASINESPWYVENGQLGAFARDLRIQDQDQPLVILLFNQAGQLTTEKDGPLQIVRAENDERLTVAAIHEETHGADLIASDDRAVLHLEPTDQPQDLRVLLWQGQPDQFGAFLELAEQHAEPDDIEQLKKPGAPQWDQSLTTQGHLGEEHGPYTNDPIEGPTHNPHDAIIRFTGLSFTGEGDALLTTMHGDLWRLEGIDESLKELSWTRMATGLNQPFGAVQHDGRIYVSEEDQLTVLHDRNGNGEADHYENFRNLIAPGPGSWQQAFGLAVDDDGYFYFARGRGRWGSGYENGVIRISPNGAEMELIASGFRQPWAMGLSPDGRVTLSQQEGLWTPQTPVHKIDLESRQGAFYGFNPDNFRHENPYPRERGYEPPIVWLPRYIDNSGGGQAWVNTDDWGLPRNAMLHISHGRGIVYHLIHEQVNGDRQGGVVPLADLNIGGARAAAFHPHDDQLYVIGIYSEGALERVRYTGEKVHHPVAFHAHENGLRLKFQHSLEPDAASDPSNYTLHRWNYRWSEEYGSAFYSAEDPDRVAEDPVEVAAVRLSDDQREVFLEIPDMKPVMQMRVRFDLQADDGTPVQENLYSTIHHLRPSVETR